MIVPGALLLAAGSAFAGEVTLFSQRDYQGNAMTIRGPAPNLERIGVNDTAASLVVREGTWEVCTDVQFRGQCMRLQPGEYSSLGISFDDRIASLREVSPSAPQAATTTSRIVTTAPAIVANAPRPVLDPALPRIVLYDKSGFAGRSVELNASVSDLERLHFGERADSAVVLNGVWRLCDDVRSRGECVELGPGRYDTLGALSGRVESAEVVAIAPPQPGPVSGGRVVLYQYPNFRGRSVVIDRAELPRLDAAYFDNGAASLRVESGRWVFCSAPGYAGECRTFGPGEYRRLPWEVDHVVSGRQLPERYSYLR
jgi:hypothetical protein